MKFEKGSFHCTHMMITRFFLFDMLASILAMAESSLKRRFLFICINDANIKNIR